MWGSYLVPIAAKGDTNAASLISSMTMIARITNSLYWQTGNYSGSTAGLVEGNYYFDSTYNQKYEYQAGVLRRFTYNQTNN